MSTGKRNFGALASAMMVGGVAAIGFAGTVHATVPVTCGAAVVGAAVGAAGWAFPNQHTAFERAANAFLPPALADVVGNVLDASAPAPVTVVADEAQVNVSAPPTSSAPAAPVNAVPTPPPVPATDPATVAALKAFAVANGVEHLLKDVTG